MAIESVVPTPKPPLRVAIFGGGVSGLTAAHELIERGFEVEVFEPERPSILEQELGDGFPCSVGGIARTQWSRVSRPEPYLVGSPMRSTQVIEVELERELAAQRITFVQKSEAVAKTAANVSALKAVKKLIGQLEAKYGPVVLQVRGFIDLVEWHFEQKDTSILPMSLGIKRAREVCKELVAEGIDSGKLTAVDLGLGSGTDFTVDDADRRIVTFKLVQDYIPGEHGFRFFPTGYRNLRDTLKRTPVPFDDVEAFVESHRTVFDNLVPAPNQAIFMNDRPSFVLPRRPVKSIQEFFDLLRQSLEASGFTFADINRFALKLFKYMTSSPDRRRGYEDVSWFDFVDGSRFSKTFQDYLESTPQALVAFKATECDARTFGNITLQLMRDQLLATDIVDGVLNGPTSLVWLYPWRRYLQSQGVRFRRGRLHEFEVVNEPGQGQSPKVFPVAVIGAELDKLEANKPYKKTVIVADYNIIALPLDNLQALICEHQASKPDKLRGRDFELIHNWELGSEGEAHPNGAMQHLSGIQFYFPTILNVLEGHAMYADSEWGLSSISQPQFWVRKRGWWDGYRSVLTVGIGNWHADASKEGPVSKWGNTGPNGEKWGWYQNREIIAKEIWYQIVQGLPEGSPVPTPILYHLDQGIKFANGINNGPTGNRSRMLMNLPGTQDERPGRLDRRKGYKLHYGNLVLAGTFMQTYFRLTTMEAANESARHAVNAILRDAHRHDRFTGDPCTVANPEENEFDDLRYFVDLDRELFEQKLPHFVDILDPSELPSDLFSSVLNLDLAKLAGIR